MSLIINNCEIIQKIVVVNVINPQSTAQISKPEDDHLIVGWLIKNGKEATIR